MPDAKDTPQWRLQLKSEPDGFGFIYGIVTTDGRNIYRVDIMPPARDWRGDAKPTEDLPHPTDWVVFLDGDEIARVQRREDIAETVLPLLAAP